MAEVWLAQQTGIEGFERQIVIKRILPHLAEDPDFVRMFLNEAKISAKFSHPNIGQIFDLGQIDGNYYIAMEYIHGEDLGRVMRKAWSTGQWISRPLALRIVASACEGLAYAHAKVDDKGRPLQVVHRDISPQNLLISFDGAVKVVDFGIAKAADANAMTKSGAIKGKFAYMSPEQAGGKPLDHRADIFAIGLILYELLTGVRPLKRDTELGTLQAALTCAIEPPSHVADVPAELDGVVMRALASAAADRYDDARQFQAALEEFLVGQRWVVGSVQIAELMRTLFTDRKTTDAELPSEQQSAPPAEQVKSPSHFTGAGKGKGPLVSPGGRHPSEISWDAPPGSSNPELRRETDPLPLRGQGTNDLVRTSQARTPAKSAPPKAQSDGGPRLSEVSTRARSAVRTPQPTAPPRPAPPAARPSAERNGSGRVVEATLEDSHVVGAAEGERIAFGRAWVKLTAVLLVGLGVAFGAFFWAPVIKPWVDRLSAKSGLEPESQAIFISVVSNLPGQVMVIHSEKNAPEPETLLGDLPLTHVAGAHVGDTIVIENKALGARFAQVLKFGEPGKDKSIRKEFKMGRITPLLKNAPAQGIGLFYLGQKVANYVPNLSFELVEGEYDLEVRGDTLRQPVPFHVKVRGDQLTKTSPIDLRPFIKE